MTGEITLRGKVLPIGGLKEKVLAARRAGIRRVIIPADNKKDLEEIPSQVRKEMTFIPVSEAEEVFKEAIEGFKIHTAAKNKSVGGVLIDGAERKMTGGEHTVPQGENMPC